MVAEAEGSAREEALRWAGHREDRRAPDPVLGEAVVPHRHPGAGGGVPQLEEPGDVAAEGPAVVHLHRQPGDRRGVERGGEGERGVATAGQLDVLGPHVLGPAELAPGEGGHRLPLADRPRGQGDIGAGDHRVSRRARGGRPDPAARVRGPGVGARSGIRDRAGVRGATGVRRGAAVPGPAVGGGQGGDDHQLVEERGVPGVPGVVAEAEGSAREEALRWAGHREDRRAPDPVLGEAVVPHRHPGAGGGVPQLEEPGDVAAEGPAVVHLHRQPGDRRGVERGGEGERGVATAGQLDVLGPHVLGPAELAPGEGGHRLPLADRPRGQGDTGAGDHRAARRGYGLRPRRARDLEGAAAPARGQRRACEHHRGKDPSDGPEGRARCRSDRPSQCARPDRHPRRTGIDATSQAVHYWHSGL